MLSGRYPDQDSLDAQFRLQDRVADYAELADARRAKSVAYAESTKMVPDLSYGRALKESLDVFPAVFPGSPVVVFIHGGCWMWNEREDYRYLAEPFVNRGVVFVNVHHTPVPEVGFQDVIDQIRDALSWIYRNVGRFGGDPDRIFVIGHSSGGHLAIVGATTDWPSRDGLPRDLVKGILCLSALTDLQAVEQSYLNETLQLTPQEVRKFSPARHIPIQAPPLLAAVGGDETEEFLRQNTVLADAWAKAGHPVDEAVYPGLNHFTILDALADGKHELTRAFLRMVEGKKLRAEDLEEAEVGSREDIETEG